MIRDPVLRRRAHGGTAEQALVVRLVVAEEDGRSAVCHELERAEKRMLGDEARCAAGAQFRLLDVDVPRPRVAIPRRREDVDRLGVGPRVRHTDRHQQVVRVALRVVDLDDPVAVLAEHTGVEQLVLGVELPAPGVLRHEIVVWERPLRVVVTPAVPRVTRERVEVPPVLLRVLAMVALIAGEPEDPLLEDRIASVPQRERQAEPLLDVGEAGQAVLPPPVRPRAGMIVRQVLPRGASGAVVLAHRPPLAFREVRAPVVPVAGLPQPVLQPAEALDPFAFHAHVCIPLISVHAYWWRTARRPFHARAAAHRSARPVRRGPRA